MAVRSPVLVVVSKRVVWRSVLLCENATAAHVRSCRPPKVQNRVIFFGIVLIESLDWGFAFIIRERHCDGFLVGFVGCIIVCIIVLLK